MFAVSVEIGRCEQLQTIREQVWQQRDFFTFDFHVLRPTDFFRGMISSASLETERGERLA